MQIIASRVLTGLSDLLGSSAPRGAGPSRHEVGISYCPSMDLVAVFPRLLVEPTETVRVEDTTGHEGPQENEGYGADDDESTANVDVYRLNGQKVFGVGVTASARDFGISDVAWRADGVLLAVVSSNNDVCLVNSFSGKIIQRFSSTSAHPSAPPRSSTESKVELAPGGVSYTTHFLESDMIHSQLASVGADSDVTLDDLLGLAADVDKLLQPRPNFPRELAGMDIEESLPLLSTLPGGALGEDDVFSTRTSVDSIFHSYQRTVKSGTIEILAVGHDEGITHVRIFDSFELGDLDLGLASGCPRGLNFQRVRRVVGHPLSRKLLAFVEEKDHSSPVRQTRSHKTDRATSQGLHAVGLDLGFLQWSPYHLPVLITKATQLHNLVRYLGQIEKQLSREIRTAFDLPARWLRNLDEDLVEQDGDGGCFEVAAMQAISMGETKGKFKEWLVEQVGERGVKRWEKAVLDFLQLARTLLAENWIPAVERVGVVVSRLTGLGAAVDEFGIGESVTNCLKDTVWVMSVLGEEMLGEIHSEAIHATAFIKWLKLEIEAAGLEETSERLEELKESHDAAELRRVLGYVKKNLRESSARKYLVQTPGHSESWSKTGLDAEKGFYSAFKESRRVPEGRLQPPTLGSLLQRLKKQYEQLSHQVGDALKKGIDVEYLGPLPSDLDPTLFDARITPVSAAEVPVHAAGAFKACVVARNRQQPQQVLVASFACHQPKPSSLVTDRLPGSGLPVDQTTEVLAVQFVDDDTVMALISTQDAVQIFGSSVHDSASWHLRHTFTGGFLETGSKAQQMAINGRKGRRAITVADTEGKGYAVYDLDTVQDGLEHDEAGPEDEDQIMTG